MPLSLMSQTVNTCVGNGISGFAGDGNSATAASIKTPDALVFDKTGNLYVSDAGNSRIRKVTPYGIITTVAGNGTFAFGGDGGLATAAQLYGPVGVAVDSIGNIFISTTADNRIRKVNTAGIITTIAGNGIPGYNGDGIPATAAHLLYPYIGAVDNSGNVYFSDYGNHRVRKINAAGIISTIAGNGSSVYGGDNGPATAAGMNGPIWLSLAPNGDIYVPDNVDHRVRKISASTGIITTFAGTGIGGNSGDGGPATSAKINFVCGVAYDKNTGDVILADRNANVIRKVNSAGIISTIAGTGTTGFSGDGGPAISAQFDWSINVAFNNAGNLFIADYNNNRIRKITYHPEGIDELSPELKNVSIYPNPTRNEITITASGEIESTEVVNMIGQVVTFVHSARPVKAGIKSQVFINVSHLPTGIYLLKVNGVFVDKFVKE